MEGPQGFASALKPDILEFSPKQEESMAKGQMRSNKEARKPKADKKSKAAPAAASPFEKAVTTGKGASGKKKG